MADQEQGGNEGAEEPRRPKVVDKRVSSGGHQPTRPTPPPEPPTPQAKSEGGSEGEAKLASDQGGRETQAENVWTPEEEAEARRMAQEIAERPALDWVVNTAVTLANVAATKLQLGDPADAQLAIDAFAGLVNAGAGRLEEAETPLRQTLAQLQMAFAERVGGPGTSPPPPEN